MIYLDNASTSPIYPTSLEKMNEIWKRWANPSSLHKKGKYNKKILEQCRLELKEIFNIGNNAEIIFTPSATIANNLVLHNATLPVLTSQFEHPSILNIPNIEIIDLEFIEEKLKQKKYLVSLSLVNNESGMIIATNPIIDLVNKYGSLLHIDASQAKCIDFNTLNCHYLTISSHKLGGPIGIACLVTKTLLKPFIFGGGQESNIISGTEAIPLIVGFTEAAKKNTETNKLYSTLNKKIFDNINNQYILNTFTKANFAEHIICLLTYKKPGTELFSYMDINNIAISYGSACSSGTLNKLKILKILNLPSKNGVRISFGYQNTIEEIEVFCELFNHFMNNE